MKKALKIIVNGSLITVALVEAYVAGCIFSFSMLSKVLHEKVSNTEGRYTRNSYRYYKEEESQK